MFYMSTLLSRFFAPEQHAQAPSERGVAMLELAIVAPLLLTLTIGVVDVSRLLLAQLALIQYAREGARVASSEQGLEQGAYRLLISGGAPSCIDVSDAPELNDPGTSCAMAPAGAQERILIRIHNLITGTSGADLVKADQIDILSEFPPGSDLVRYTIRVPFNGFYLLFEDQPIVVSATGPYM